MIRLCWLDGDSSMGRSGFVVYLADSNVLLFFFFLPLERIERICILRYWVLRQSEESDRFVFE